MGAGRAWSLEPAGARGGGIDLRRINCTGTPDQCAAQEMLGHFARSNSTRPDRPVEFRMRKPSGILNVFDSENHKLVGGRLAHDEARGTLAEQRAGCT